MKGALSRYTGRAALVLFLAGAVAAASAAKVNLPSRPDAPWEDQVGRFGMSAVNFRLAAAEDTDRAIREHGSPTCLAAWKKKVSPFFQGQELQWQDFFSSAVIEIGCVADDRATVAFFNPWHDALLLTEWKLSHGSGVMRSFLIVTGDSWRGDGLPAVPVPTAWEASKAPIAEALAGTVAANRRLLERRLPLAGPCSWEPAAAADVEARQLEELATLKVRMLVRFAMFRDYLYGEGHHEQVRETVTVVADLVSRGQRRELLEMLRGASEQVMVDRLFSLPPQIRAGLAPNFVHLGPEGGVACLVSSLAPKTIVFVYLKGISLQPWTVEVLDIEQLHLLDRLAAARDGRR